MKKKRDRRASFLTPHDMRRLDWACAPVRRGFHPLFLGLVGSVLTHSEYRDIDIRLVLPDEELQALTGGSHDRHMLLNVALAELISRAANMTRPIDFQLQSQSEHAEHKGRPRNSLGTSA